MKRNTWRFLCCVWAIVFAGWCQITAVEADEKKAAMMLETEYQNKIDRTKHIILQDACAGAYQESMNLEIEKEDVDRFLKLCDSVEYGTDETSGRRLYRLAFLDEDRQEIDSWIVTTAYAVFSDSGYLLSRSGKLEEWLDKIERKYGITYELFNKTPGENYFSLLSEAETICLTEWTDNNFQEGKHYWLSVSEIEELKEMSGELYIGQNQEIPKKYWYQMFVYSGTGEELYNFIIDDEGFMFTGSGYEVIADPLQQWLEKFAKKMR